MADSVGVVFEQKYRPYNAGEVAGFDADEAAELVANGIARYRDPDDAPEALTAPAVDSVSTHEMTVSEVRDAVESASATELEAMLASERSHPDYDGGRSTALAAIRGALEDSEDA